MSIHILAVSLQIHGGVYRKNNHKNLCPCPCDTSEQNVMFSSQLHLFYILKFVYHLHLHQLYFLFHFAADVSLVILVWSYFLLFQTWVQLLMGCHLHWVIFFSKCIYYQVLCFQELCCHCFFFSLLIFSPVCFQIDVLTQFAFGFHFGPLLDFLPCRALGQFI